MVGVVAHTSRGDVVCWVESVEPGSGKFTHLCCRVEDCGKAGEKSYVEGVICVEFVPDERYHLRGDQLVLVLLNCGWGELSGSFQHCADLLLMQDPGETIESVPGTDTVDIVVDCFA